MAATIFNQNWSAAINQLFESNLKDTSSLEGLFNLMYKTYETRKNFSLLTRRIQEEFSFNAISGEGFGDYNQLFKGVNLNKPSWEKIKSNFKAVFDSSLGTQAGLQRREFNQAENYT